MRATEGGIGLAVKGESIGLRLGSSSVNFGGCAGVYRIGWGGVMRIR